MTGGGGFCCVGCRVVHGLLHRNGLARYYDLRSGALAPAPPPAPPRDLKWLEATLAETARAQGATRIVLDVQGLQCAACVWVLEQLFQRHPGALRVVVNPAVGQVDMLVTREFPLREYVTDTAALGYLLGPMRKSEGGRGGALPGRIGLCAALALNVMLFSLPIELGLRQGVVYLVFRWLALVLATASVAAGGPVFFSAAWQGLRRGVLHLDLPIALGILLAYGGSVWAFAARRDGGVYLDTVATFIVLMLTGRWLQERVLERNRLLLLASEGADALLARRVRDDSAVDIVPCRDLRAGDLLLIAPGDLVPVPSTLQDGHASCSLDWITGESAPGEYTRGDPVPAGAFNLGVEAVTVRATDDFTASPLPALLRSPPAVPESGRSTAWWQRLTRRYVVAVLSTAAAGFTLWVLCTRDVPRALEIATAVLVVTCPCAFGLATPLAYELVQAGLRRAGLFVRSSTLLDRLPAVRRVVFDKTGTLTTGVPELSEPSVLAALSPDAREVLYNLAVRSTHPRSAAVRRGLEATSVPRPGYIQGLAAREHPGQGLELSRDGRLWRLGRGAWAAPEDPSVGPDPVFSLDGRAIVRIETVEALRPGAGAEVTRLKRLGYDVWILSGDAPARVTAMALALDIDPSHALGGMDPEAKAAWLAAHDARDTLMIGDGVNDALAVSAAYCSGTPAIDRPFMPARADFYFVTAGLGPVRLALRAARALEAIHRRNLAVAVGYNLATVTAALSGQMSPLLCAVVMPLSSLSLLLATAATLRPGSALWKS